MYNNTLQFSNIYSRQINSINLHHHHHHHNDKPSQISHNLDTPLPRATVGYEPAGLTVHPPPRMIEGGFIFFVWVSSVTKIVS